LSAAAATTTTTTEALLHWREGIAPTGYYDEPGSLSEKKTLKKLQPIAKRSLAANAPSAVSPGCRSRRPP
jgi:hypothetical protein